MIDKLVEEFSEDINGNEMIYNGTLNYYEKICSSFTIYTALLANAFLIIIGISKAYFYFHWHLKDNTIINTGVNTETVIY